MKEFKKDKLNVKILPSRKEMGECAAADIRERINALLSERDEINMIFAAAPSQSDALASLVAYGDIEWNRVNAYHMDEYIGLTDEFIDQRFAKYPGSSQRTFRTVFLWREVWRTGRQQHLSRPARSRSAHAENSQCTPRCIQAANHPASRPDTTPHALSRYRRRDHHHAGEGSNPKALDAPPHRLPPCGDHAPTQELHDGNPDPTQGSRHQDRQP